MSIRKRRSDQSGRAPLPSPGRPPVAGRDERRRFWAAIAAGLASEDAAAAADVPPAVGTRWFRKAGGMPPAMLRPSAKPLSGRYLSFAEREEIALLRVQGHAMQEIARRPGRAASRSPGSYGATLPPEVAAWSIARQQRNGTPSEPLVAQSRRSLRSTQLCEPMWRTDWLASSSLRAGLLFLARPCPGRAVGPDGGRTGDGRAPGARSRSPGDCRSTSRTMRPCASATRPSTKRCASKGVASCAANSRPACAAAGRGGSRGHVRADEARALSLPRS